MDLHRLFFFRTVFNTVEKRIRNNVNIREQSIEKFFLFEDRNSPKI
jgi:hypothetical protein